VNRVRRNPLKRALRVDKMTIAGLASILVLYLDPDRLPERLPVLRMLTRAKPDIRAAAERLQPPVAAAVGNFASVQVVDCESQIGSGALPTQRIPSAGLALRPQGRRSGALLNRISAAFRNLPVPVIGRIHEEAFIMDLRCLEDEQGFAAQLTALTRQLGPRPA
jgi:L-seryl-tRNA(Ser) seleniumtransferase